MSFKFKIESFVLSYLYFGYQFRADFLHVYYQANKDFLFSSCFTAGYIFRKSYVGTSHITFDTTQFLRQSVKMQKNYYSAEDKSSNISHLIDLWKVQGCCNEDF